MKALEDQVIVKEIDLEKETSVLKIKETGPVFGEVKAVGPEVREIEVGHIVSFFRKAAIKRDDVLIIMEDNVEMIHGRAE
jgi:hypothetical protein